MNTAQIDYTIELTKILENDAATCLQDAYNLLREERFLSVSRKFANTIYSRFQILNK